ncbi:MAG: DUF2723 domain-containing protein [candidate division Zixibacteria bacterium]
MSKRRGNFILFFTPFALSFILYLKTACPTVFVGDSGELTTAIYTLGIAHPPGYPLLTLLGKFYLMFSIGNPAYALNIFAGLCASVSAGFVSLIVKKIVFTSEDSNNTWILALSIISGCLWATSNALWASATAFEVYSFGIMIISIIVYFLIRYIDSSRFCFIAVSIYLLSLGLANHLTVSALLPGVVFLIVSSIDFKKQILLFLLFAFGLTIYLYIPLRSAQYPLIDWGHPATFSSFWEHVSARRYEAYLSGIGLGNYFAGMARGFRILGEQYPTGLIYAGFLGLLISVRGKIKITLILMLVANLAIVSTYEIPDMDQYYLPTSFVLTIGMIALISSISKWISARRAGIIAMTIMIIALCVSSYSNYRPNDQSSNTLAYDYGIEILNSVPGNSILVTFGDKGNFPILYLHHVEKIRSDLKIYDPAVTINSLARVLSFDRNFGNMTPLDLCLKIMTKNPKKSYLVKDHLLAGESPFKYHNMSLTSHGLTYRWGNHLIDSTLVERYTMDSKQENLAAVGFRGITTLCNYYLAIGEHKRLSGESETAPDEFHIAREIALLLDDARTHNAMGVFFRRQGWSTLAEKEYEIALNSSNLNSNINSDILTNIGNLRKDEGRFEDALGYYDRAIENSDKNTSAVYNKNITTAYLELSRNGFEKAIESFKRAILDPDADPNIYLNIGIIYDRHLNNRLDALNYYRQYIELAPETRRAEQVRIRIREIIEEG